MNVTVFKYIFLFLLLSCIFNFKVVSQENNYKHHFIGILPSILAEPYDTLNAVELNILPIIYAYRIKENFELQLRPIINYRFYQTNSGISQTGGTITANRYFDNVWDKDFWLVPQLALFYTYTYNQLDKIQTMTLGIEPGVNMKLWDAFSMSLNIQPGINYYPDAYSREFTNTSNGFKFHFGLIFYFGYSF